MAYGNNGKLTYLVDDDVVMEDAPPLDITMEDAPPLMLEPDRLCLTGEDCATRDQVINTTELLERILLQLPIRRVFVFQRVCKYWLEVIRKSPDLQVYLYQRMTRRAKATFYHPGNFKYVFNPEIFETHRHPGLPIDSNYILRLIRLNTSRHIAITLRQLGATSDKEGCAWDRATNHFRSIPLIPFRKSGAAYDAMYITQPPLRWSKICRFVFLCYRRGELVKKYMKWPNKSASSGVLGLTGLNELVPRGGGKDHFVILRSLMGNVKKVAPEFQNFDFCEVWVVFENCRWILKAHMAKSDSE